MKSAAKILTLHPEGKSGVNISLTRYHLIKDYILDTLKQEGELSYKDLNARAKKDLSSSFDGKIGWYLVTIKLDLEARNIIERIKGKGPHRIRLNQKSSFGSNLSGL